MPAERIIIHAGHAKTGTTSIQGTLFSAREALLQHGVYYPSFSANCNRLLSAFSQDPHSVKMNGKLTPDRIEQLDRLVLQQIDDDLRSQHFRTAIFSSEYLQNLDEEGMRRLAEFFEQYTTNLQVLIYVRHPVAYAQSWVQERVKSGNASLAALLERTPIFRFSRILPLWVQAFGRERTLVRPFEREAMVNGDLIADFVEACDLPPISKWGTPLISRESLSLPAILLLDALYRASLSSPNKKTVQLLATIAGPKFTLPPRALRQVRKRAVPELKYLQREFGITLKDPKDQGIPFENQQIFTDDAILSIVSVLDELCSRQRHRRAGPPPALPRR